MQRLLDIKITQIEMVRDRGYDIGNERAILSMTLDQFVAYFSAKATQLNTSFRSALSNMYITNEPEQEKRRIMLVYYGGRDNSTQKQVSVHVARQFIKIIQDYAVHEAVLIVDAPLSTNGNNEISSLTLVKKQIFFDSDLTYNPVNHVDTPRHELLSPEETSAKLREMKTDVSGLLIIKSTDPVVRYYGWSPGGLVRVHRNDSSISVLAPQSINYRIIVG